MTQVSAAWSHPLSPPSHHSLSLSSSVLQSRHLTSEIISLLTWIYKGSIVESRGRVSFSIAGCHTVWNKVFHWTWTWTGAKPRCTYFLFLALCHRLTAVFIYLCIWWVLGDQPVFTWHFINQSLSIPKAFGGQSSVLYSQGQFMDIRVLFCVPLPLVLTWQPWLAWNHYKDQNGLECIEMGLPLPSKWWN